MTTDAVHARLRAHAIDRYIPDRGVTAEAAEATTATTKAEWRRPFHASPPTRTPTATPQAEIANSFTYPVRRVGVGVAHLLLHDMYMYVYM